MSLTINPEGIPAELRARAQWVVWRYEEVEGRKTKVPYCCATGKHASTKDATTWTAFEAAEVCCRARKYDGVGYVFDSGDPYVGIDLDHCLDPETGEIEPEAAQWLALLDSYSERTPSGEGIHVICRGSFVGPGRKNDRIEMYQQGRFFTMTGQQIAGEAGVIAARDFQVKLMYGAVFPPKPTPAPPPAAVRRPPPVNGTSPDDAALVDKVLREGKYVALWQGNYAGYKSPSEADLALCGRIAFFAGPDPPTIDRIFRQSGLWREKWDSPHHGSAGSSYGRDTIAAALAGKSEFYDWDRPAGGRQNEPQRAVPVNGVEDAGTSVVSVVGRKALKPPKTPENLEPEAYHGLPGRVLRTIAPHTESHPAGLLGSFLTCGGCLIGPGPHVFRDGQRHACNEFAILMGKTGSGRKGSSTRRVEEIFKYSGNIDSTEKTDVDMHERENREQRESKAIDLGWYDLVLRGLGSGEALVAALAEAAAEGPSGARRIVFEQEFARCLKVMQREGSTLSDMLKSAWDSEPLHVRTKARLLRADASHVSILAHVTEADLKERLAQVELFNGFGNRFLWFATRRVNSLPFGGGQVPLAPLVSAVHRGLARARWLHDMEFDRDAAQIWEQGRIYDMLNAARPGLLGAVTDRAAAHVTRVALQYAVWDGVPAIGVPHLLAGLAVWDYSEKTCVSLFGRSTGDSYADTILEKVSEVHPGYLTRKEIRDLFSRNAAPGRIPVALETLEELGKIERRKAETGGHPAEIVVLSEATTYDQNDQSPLEAARKQAKEAGYTTETTEVAGSAETGKS